MFKKISIPLLNRGRLSGCFLFFISLFLVAPASLSAQSEGITIEGTHTVKAALKLIEQQSDARFIYNDNFIDYDKEVKLALKAVSVAEALTHVLQGQRVRYDRQENGVYLFAPGEAEAPVPQQQNAATGNMMISGTVQDRTGSPLSNVSVSIRGSQTGTTTNNKGEFRLQVSRYDSLDFSYVGYKDLSIFISDIKPLTIIMDAEAGSLNEVSVVAYSRQKKASVLGSITTIKPEELRVPSSNLTTAFAGRVAGMISYQRSGEPGRDNASFFIRGITTFGAEAKKDPLILIDGIELGPDDLARLNTDDIASFSIMKDATATSLYGARGANGVIFVTTKEGREGKVQVNLRIENSSSSATEKVQIADPVTFMRMQNEAVKTRDPLGLALYSEEKITMTEMGLHRDIYPSTDWNKAMFRDHIINNRVNVNLRGGGNVARYYVGASVTKDNGNMIVDKRNNFNSNISLMKYQFRSNVNINLTKTTEMITRFAATFDDYTGPIDGGAAMYRKVLQANPVLFKPYYEPDSVFSYAKHILFGNFGDANYLNPYAESLKGYRDYSKNTMFVTFEFKQNLKSILKGLTARTLINFDRYSEYNVTRAYFPFYYNLKSFDLIRDTYTLMRLNPAQGTEYINYLPGQRFINNVFYFEGATEYNGSFGRHNINSLLVFTARQERKGIADNLQLSLPGRNAGLAGRFAYNYDTRYFAELNFGYNGSERFSKNNRWGFFPSVSAGWMLSNEKFFEPLRSVVKQLKLRGSYGMVGNDAIGSSLDRFFYLSQVTLNAPYMVNWGINMNENPLGVRVDRYANDQIGWETSYKKNLGLEINLVNGISSIIEVYHERRTNILLSRIIPATMGIIPEVKANLGEAEGKGIDIELNYDKSFSSGLWINGRGTFTYATNKVLKWEEPDYSTTPWKSRVGHPIGQVWGYVADRLFIDSLEVKNSPLQTFGAYSAGDIKYHDINRDGKIDELDMVPIGHPVTPEIVYGFGTSLGYRGFDLSVFFQGTARQSFWFNMQNVTPFIDGDSDDGRIGQNAVLKVFADSYWSESNRNPYALWPRLSNYTINNNTQTSTWFMQNAGFIRLKSAEIGYTVPKTLLNRYKIANLRIYFSGLNLFYWSSFKLWDPEMAGEGLGYPVQKVYNIGLNIGF
ncbi:TonB-dependent receptor [Niabella beijingensis]|uniref:TonB-dependent receptor n=1 Tax=Niabella beijingensis TaxID=2872700 RepID=UPI001CBABE22|nr:TonB-dependent receptor [Niabella beijingensis]MBZ4190346.1 TonB-dependent receptor [Niabella beijingensis]